MATGFPEACSLSSRLFSFISLLLGKIASPRGVRGLSSGAQPPVQNPSRPEMRPTPAPGGSCSVHGTYQIPARNFDSFFSVLYANNPEKLRTDDHRRGISHTGFHACDRPVLIRPASFGGCGGFRRASRG